MFVIAAALIGVDVELVAVRFDEASFTTEAAVLTVRGCGASVVEVAFGLLMGVAEAVAGVFLSFWSALFFLPEFFLLDAPLFELSPALLLLLRGAMLFPFSVAVGVFAACGGAASVDAAETKRAKAVVYRTFFMMHSLLAETFRFLTERRSSTGNADEASLQILNLF